MKSITLAAALALALPTLAAAETAVVWTGNSLVGYEQWLRIVEDRDPADGCGPLALEAFSGRVLDAVKQGGCIRVPWETEAALKADDDPRDGCGRIPLGFLMPAARPVIEQDGCPGLLSHPWD